MNSLYGKIIIPKINDDDHNWFDTISKELEKSRAGILITVSDQAYEVYNKSGIEAMCEHIENFPFSRVTPVKLKEYILRDPSSPLSEDDKAFLAIYEI